MDQRDCEEAERNGEAPVHQPLRPNHVDRGHGRTPRRGKLRPRDRPGPQRERPDRVTKETFGTEDAPIFTANPDGTHEQLLLPPGYGCPSWSPDGAKVLVCTFGPEGPRATLDADGSGLKLLDNPDPSLHLFCTSWSPDGARLACESGTDPASSRNGIYTVRSSDGGDLTRVTKNPFGLFSCCPPRAQDADPSYSPNGRQITFSRQNDKVQSAIFIVNTDGSGERQVTPWGLGGAGGEWSPDGKWIVFVISASGAADQVESLGCIFVPTDGMVIFLFRGPTKDRIRDRSESAEVPFDWIVESIHIGLGGSQNSDRYRERGVLR
jgi:dipeptidyl aminopeptidase/acylaminoacyl peptidase